MRMMISRKVLTSCMVGSAEVSMLVLARRVMTPAPRPRMSMMLRASQGKKRRVQDLKTPTMRRQSLTSSLVRPGRMRLRELEPQSDKCY